jgi:hypothetical protein
MYCCKSPRLRWDGPPHNCAIACLNCGFRLADDGQLGDWHDPEQIAAARELSLFDQPKPEEPSCSS